MSPRHSSSPSQTGASRLWLPDHLPLQACSTPQVEVRVLQRSQWVLDGRPLTTCVPGSRPPPARSRHLLASLRASPPSLIRAAAGAGCVTSRLLAPGSSSRQPSLLGHPDQHLCWPSCDATAPLSTADTQPLGWPCPPHPKEVSVKSGMRLGLRQGHSAHLWYILPTAGVPSQSPGHCPTWGLKDKDGSASLPHPFLTLPDPHV